MNQGPSDLCELVLSLPPIGAVRAWRAVIGTDAATLVSRSRAAIGNDGTLSAGTGHQPGFFHAGILAKFLVAAAASDALGSTNSWLHFLSDADAVDPFRLDLPMETFDGSVRRATVRLSATNSRHPTAAACTRAAVSSVDRESVQASLKQPLASPRADKALAFALEALGAHSHARNAAEQTGQAVEETMFPRVRGSARIISTLDLVSSPFGRWATQKILDEPERCATTFNAALTLAPHSARMLKVAGDSSEVPFWGVGVDGGRERIGATEARRREAAGAPLLPRAFLASGLMRLHTDLFVHGTGAAIYERAGNKWWSDFFGIEMPPFAIASATLHCSREALGIPLRAASGAKVPYRTAWWNPRLLADVGATNALGADRNRQLERIASAPRKSTERRQAYQDLMAMIDRERSDAATALERLRSHEAFHARAMRDEVLLNDRTWPFLLQDPSQLDALERVIRARVQAWAGTGGESGSGR